MDNEMDWDGLHYGKKDKKDPKRMHQARLRHGKYHPCDCEICFFCLNGKDSSSSFAKHKIIIELLYSNILFYSKLSKSCSTSVIILEVQYFHGEELIFLGKIELKIASH